MKKRKKVRMVPTLLPLIISIRNIVEGEITFITGRTYGLPKPFPT